MNELMKPVGGNEFDFEASKYTSNTMPPAPNNYDDLPPMGNDVDSIDIPEFPEDMDNPDLPMPGDFDDNKPA